MNTSERDADSELEFHEEVAAAAGAAAAAAYSIDDMTEAYLKAYKKDWLGFKKFYDTHGEDALFSPLTVNGDNAFHLAAASKDAKLVKALLDKLPDPFKKLEALTAPDDHRNTALHEVATTNCVDAAKQMVAILLLCGNENQKKLLIWNKLGETPLYRAAALGKKKMVQYLAKQTDPNVLHLHFRRYDEISILHIAVIGQHFETAVWLLEKEEQLLGTRENYGEGEEKLAKREEKNGLTSFNLLALMPTVFRSTARSISKWKAFVYFCAQTLSLHDHNDEDKDEEEDKFSSSQGQDLETGKNKNESVCQTKDQTAISKMWIAMQRGLIKGCPKLKKIWKEKRKYESALRLVDLLAEQDTSWKECYKDEKDATISLGLGKGEARKIPDSEDHKAPASRGKDKSTASKSSPKAKTNPISSSTKVSNDKKKRSGTEAPLIMAATNGITEIFDAIITKHPQAVDYISDYGQNMLHAAIMFRQKIIFDRILSMEKKLVHRLATRIDKFGYTVLHHVADMYYYRGGTRSGPALQFQEELEWFENVKAIMPSHYAMHRSNKRRMTAGDLFDEEHKKQLRDAQQWMKGTADSCSTVSILVATVVFAAAYTVPGGNTDQGVPIFLHSPLFWVFTVMDVVSLISSLCSVVIFLSILTSPFKSEAFLKSLPRKLTIGFSLLFFSVLSSMITFTAALLLLLRLNRRWTATLVYVAAFIPVVLFALMQFPMYSEFLGSLTDLFIKKFKWTSTGKKNKK